MDKELLFEDTKFIESQKKEAQKKVFAINTTLDSLLEKLGCVLSNEEVENFMRYPDGLFEIVWVTSKSVWIRHRSSLV